MDKLELFKSKRSVLNRHVSIPIDGERSKFETNDRKIAGYPIVWGEQNDYREIVLKGATQKSLNARGVGGSKNQILVLNQHRQAEILCKPTVLQEDDYGLWFEGEIITGVRYADEALAQIRQGVLRQLSYGFDYIYDKIQFDEENDSVILKEIKLWEISLVTFSSGDSAQLRGYNEFQIDSILNKYTSEQINDIQNLFALRQGAVTNTQQPIKKIDQFNSLKKLF